jgi:hypothetical protein
MWKLVVNRVMYTVQNPQYTLPGANDTGSHHTTNTYHKEGTIMAKAKEDGEKKVSQKKMVQAALDHCGPDAKPGEMGSYIMETFKTDLAPNIISNYKSQIKREGSLPGASAGRTRKSGSLQIEDFETVRNLVERLGATQVKKIVDVVG